MTFKIGLNIPNSSGVYLHEEGLIWDYKLFQDETSRGATLIAFEYKSGQYIEEFIFAENGDYAPNIESFLKEYSNLFIKRQQKS